MPEQGKMRHLSSLPSVGLDEVWSRLGELSMHMHMHMHMHVLVATSHPPRGIVGGSPAVRQNACVLRPGLVAGDEHHPNGKMGGPDLEADQRSTPRLHLSEAHSLQQAPP